MYNQIYEIIKTAVFETEHVLTAGQTFALEQISLWLSLAVLLLPLIVGVAILVRCVRR